MGSALREVTNPRYHIWTDALHGRELARQARNRWDRGTYVRWTIVSTCTAIEMACQDALQTKNIGHSFRKDISCSLSKLRAPAICWGHGIWQKVLALREKRVYFVHINAAQRKLFPGVHKADEAIKVAREAIADVYTRVGKRPPPWVQDDSDPGWDTGATYAHAQILHRGAQAEDPNSIRIGYEYKGRKYVSDIWSPGTDYSKKMDDLLEGLQCPVTALLAWRGEKEICRKEVRMRKS